MTEKSIPQKLWTKEVKRRIQDKTAWALLRTMIDPRTNEMYFDILAGEKGKKPHTHVGYNFDETPHFFENRGVVAEMERTISQNEKVLDKRKAVFSDSPANAKQLVFKFKKLPDPSKEIVIERFAFE